MKKSPLTLLLTLLLLLTVPIVKAQTFVNDFENGSSEVLYWSNLHLVADTLLLEHAEADTLTGEGNDTTSPAYDTMLNHRYVCEPEQEYGLGFSYPVPDSLHGQNLHLIFQADCAFPESPHPAIGRLVCTIKGPSRDLYWTSYDLGQYANDSAEWFLARFELDLPSDLLHGNSIKLYLWNQWHQCIWMDNVTVTLTPWTLPSFLPPTPPMESNVKHGLLATDLYLSIPDDSIPLSYPIGMLTEYILNGDSLRDYQQFQQTENGQWKVENGLLTTTLTNTSTLSTFHFQLSTVFQQKGQLLRQALVVPFIDSTLTVYRKNLAVDSDLFQSEYYLDREGFKVGEGDRTVLSYHPCQLSSTQLDAVHRVAYFNLDYWRDHPMIHYPLSDTLEDVFEDVSYRQVLQGMRWDHTLELSVGHDVRHLPRLMPIPYGYESGIIFTEHADWTDIRTHRAVLFGSEKITKARKATGGFVHYGIPVTKSVFYNNPDRVTNDAISHGTFKGLHATIKTDPEFEKLLKQLYKIGFDICLHTPEQYTTTPGNLEEALDYMQRHFKSTTWIDHGYNNGPQHNREDLVCDGLNRQSDVYAGSQWQSHGIRYLWNAYYEEKRMEGWDFDNSLMRPYPGFGDALPNRQVTTLEAENGTPTTFLTWCTPATLEAVTDNDWAYYYSASRLQRLVDNHDVHITHIYPAWVRPGRTFWTYDADSTIVALPGMNHALARIANLRDEQKMLPMTVKTYLDYYSGLLQVSYEIIDANHIQLHNKSDQTLKGFTLLCPGPIRFEDNRYYEFHSSGGQYYIWFDLKPNDQVTIRIEN